VKKLYIAHINERGDIQTCNEHSRNTAAYAEGILKDIGLANAGYVAGLLHDMGKFTEKFKQYIQDAIKGEAARGSVTHTFAGVFYLLRGHNAHGGDLDCRDIASELLALAVASHHGLMDCYNEEGRSGFLHRLRKQPDYERLAIRAFLQECASKDELNERIDNAEAELTEMLNKIVEMGTESGEDVHFYAGALARLLTSAVVAADRTDTARFMLGIAEETARDAHLWDTCERRIEQHINGFPSDTPIQRARRAFSDECLRFAREPCGIYRLDLPTGGGKTLAGLRYAVSHAKHHSKRRIIYAAPLLSIIEQNAAVIRSAVGDDSLVLEHHSDILRERENSETAQMPELLQENWDAPVIVTTLVRILETLFSGKMADVRRFSALCNSVIVFDEIQSLPRNMLTIFNLMMNFLSRCCGATVILCSATQPEFAETQYPMRISPKDMIDKETLGQYADLFKRTHIRDDGNMRFEDLAKRIEEILVETESLLVVCNTKRQASELFSSVDLPGVLKFHLSAGMCMAHRKATLERMLSELKQGTKLLCVSTQVIEAGIDISFSEVIRLSAGLDSIVQSAGRCNRHAESAEPKPVHIVRLSEENLGKLKEIRDAQDAMNDLLTEYKYNPEHFGGDLASDASVRYYYRQLYRRMKCGDADYPIPHQPTLFSMLSMNDTYVGRSKENNRYFMEQAFREAGKKFQVFEETSESVLVPYEGGRGIIAALNGERVKYDYPYVKRLLQEAKQYTVSVYRDALKRLEKLGAVREICDGSVMILNEGYYDCETGIMTEREIKEGMPQCDTLIL
jgi:CRISPR-associated endonuclease/helicase Cas3